MKRALAPCLLSLVLAAHAHAETYPPGDYTDTGRVVRTAQGTVDLFDGHGCMLQLNEELQARLAQHMGEFVRVDTTRVEETPEMVIDAVGAPIGKIREITTIAKDAGSLPVTIAVEVLADTFRIGDPIRIRVTFTNRTDETIRLDRGLGDAHLLRDYRWALSLAPENVGPQPRGGRRIHLDPRKTAVRESSSAWMAEPGRYDLVYAVYHPDLPCAVQSDPVTVTVLPPRDDAEEIAALRTWLARASATQRVAIAERLLAHDDDRGVDVVLRLMEEQHEWGSFTHGPVYRFLWRHGGERGEHAMLTELARKERQSPALCVIEELHLSPRRSAVLESLLADRRETARDTQGWCARPRVCDITAAWLVGYTDYEMTFPQDDTPAERDVAVATVLATLQDEPARFSVLR